MGHKVSVIIPTYKRSLEYVSRAVNSVLGQTHEDVEIVCIDDSPSDFEERNLIKEYMQGLKDDNVIYIQNEKNMGGALSRNIGIEKCNGDYITFLDDDDEYLPEKVKSQLDYMVSTDTDLTLTKMMIYDPEGKLVDVREHNLESYDNEYLLRYHLCKHLTGTPTFMFKAEKLKMIGGFDDAKCGQEFYLMLKSIENNLKISYIPECNLKVYKHKDGGISSGMNKIIGEKALYDIKKKYFKILSYRERRYLKFRHKVVMAISYKRNSMYKDFLISAISAVIASPWDCFNEVIKFFGKILKNAKNC